MIGTLATAGLNPRTSNLDEIRKQQVLSFDVSDLPAIQETWLGDSKGGRRLSEFAGLPPAKSTADINDW